MEKFVLINLSNRHIHVSQQDLEALFGPGHQLKNIKNLMQPGQFACEETVTLVGPKGSIENVRILGPVRAQTQVEVLQSDVFKLGKIQPPVRESGALAGSAPFKLVGPKGTIEKSEGMVIAMRHVHMDPVSAERYGCKDKDVVKLRVGIPGREAILENVVIRVSPSYALECHIDFDEGNAVGIGNGSQGEIIR
jgi:putative phosphotransacetylase